MNNFSDIKSYKNWLNKTRVDFFEKNKRFPKIGFVPTMGALHEGHISLVKEAQKECDFTVLSIFVNPSQFVKGEDFEKYPRPVSIDLDLAKRSKVDVVFLPEVGEIYPAEFSSLVSEQSLSKELCGVYRPCHFDGVTTIVLKLFNMIEPTHAYFGLKDAQQFFVIQKIVSDLNINVALKGVATLREKDGLALSSRNIYLSESERLAAPRLYQVLSESKESLFNKPLKDVLLGARTKLEKSGFTFQYLEVLALPLLSRLQGETLEKGKEYIIATACFLGKTRLIDNIIFKAE